MIKLVICSIKRPPSSEYPPVSHRRSLISVRCQIWSQLTRPNQIGVIGIGQEGTLDVAVHPACVVGGGGDTCHDARQGCRQTVLSQTSSLECNIRSPATSKQAIPYCQTCISSLPRETCWQSNCPVKNNISKPIACRVITCCGLNDLNIRNRTVCPKRSIRSE